MQLERKQKVMLVLTVLTFGILIWQVYDLVSGDVASKPKPVVKKVHKKAVTTSKPVASKSKATVVKATPTNTTTSTTAKMEMSKPVIQTQAPNTAAQKEYVHMSNQYELAKMQRQLLEEEVAIATAKNRIAKLNHETEGLSGTGGATVSTTDASDIMVSGHDFRLAYLAKQGTQWIATLEKDGKFYSVSSNDRMSNGVKILVVNRNGVILEQGNMRKKITFNGIVAQAQVYSPPPGGLTTPTPVFTPPQLSSVSTPNVEDTTNVSTSEGLTRDKLIKKPIQ